MALDGSIQNIDDYEMLAVHFRDNLRKMNYYGGNGTTTFVLPDARGDFIRGYDSGKYEILKAILEA